MAPPAPSAQLAEVARDTNLAARFGQMEIALKHTSEGAREHFQKHRREWGGAVRVLDFDLTGLSMKDPENATVMVDIQWTRVDDDTLKTTRVEQTFRGSTVDTGWSLIRERRVSGDLGLFGEPIPRLAKSETHADVQFASKTLGHSDYSGE
jgi:hypothetical protein